MSKIVILFKLSAIDFLHCKPFNPFSFLNMFDSVYSCVYECVCMGVGALSGKGVVVRVCMDCVKKYIINFACICCIGIDCL